MMHLQIGSSHICELQQNIFLTLHHAETYRFDDKTYTS